MSTDRDTTRLVRSWLEEGVTALTDRVLDAVLDQVPATPQRRSWWPARRLTQMKRVFLAAATAAAVLVAILGYNLLGIGTPTPTTAPATPTPLPTIGPVPSGGAIEPGRYFWTVGSARVTVTVPAGWVAEGAVIQKGEVSLEPVIDSIAGVFADACEGTTLSPLGPTAADLVTALETQLSIDTVVKAIDVGGVPATRIDIAAAAGLDRASCSEGAEGPIKIWRHSGQAGYFALPPGFTGSVVTLDVRGTRLVFRAVKSLVALAADVSELDAAIASMAIAP